MFVSFGAGNNFVTTALHFLNVNLTRLSGIQLTVNFSPFGPSHTWDFSCVVFFMGSIVHPERLAVNRVVNGLYIVTLNARGMPLQNRRAFFF